jgi:hypothetical protein
MKYKEEWRLLDTDQANADLSTFCAKNHIIGMLILPALRL